MLNNFKFLAHFSDVNLGAIRDGVLFVHISSDLPDSLYKSVLQQYPLDMSSSEREHHSKALIEYAAYSNSAGKSKFFYWLTPAPSSKTYPKNNKDKDTSLRYETSRPAPVVPSDDGDGAPLQRHYPRYESLKETVPVLDDDIPPIFNQISLTEIHVDSDLPFCPACELAQIDISAPYACQCSEV